MLALGDLIARYLTNDAYGWERHLDPTLARQIAAIQLAVHWQYGARPTDPSILGRASYAIMEARMKMKKAPSDQLSGLIIWKF